MPEAHYPFASIQSAAASEDGKRILLDVAGAGIEGLSLSLEDVPRAITLVFNAAREARKRSGEDKYTLKSTPIRNIRVIEPPNTEMVLLEVMTESMDGPGQVFHLPRSTLQKFARQVLEPKGR